MKFATTEFELVELLTRIFSDVEASRPADAVYVFSQTPDNEESEIKTAVGLLAKSKATRIAFLEKGILTSGLPFFPKLSRKFLNYGISKEAMIPLQPPKGTSVHTHTESIMIASYAKKMGWKALYITSSPFHQVRAFVDVISIVLHEYPELKVYSKVGTPLPWGDNVLHSQMVLRGTRRELIASELKRIKCYHKKGDLVTAREVLDYLNRRDNII